jgi:hypothetical protein
VRRADAPGILTDEFGDEFVAVLCGVVSLLGAGVSGHRHAWIGHHRECDAEFIPHLDRVLHTNAGTQFQSSRGLAARMVDFMKSDREGRLMPLTNPARQRRRDEARIEIGNRCRPENHHRLPAQQCNGTRASRA